jgi:hypothetical protein
MHCFLRRFTRGLRRGLLRGLLRKLLPHLRRIAVNRQRQHDGKYHGGGDGHRRPQTLPPRLRHGQWFLRHGGARGLQDRSIQRSRRLVAGRRLIEAGKPGIGGRSIRRWQIFRLIHIRSFSVWRSLVMA